MDEKSLEEWKELMKNMKPFKPHAFKNKMGDIEVAWENCSYYEEHFDLQCYLMRANYEQIDSLSDKRPAKRVIGISFNGNLLDELNISEEDQKEFISEIDNLVKKFYQKRLDNT